MSSICIIIITSLSMAFCWVEFINPWKKTKPFNCIKCMTGWISGIVSLLIYGYEMYWLHLPNHVPILGYIYSIAMLAVGVFVGAMFEGIRMRWL